MKVIIWTNPELGNVCVCTCAPGVDLNAEAIKVVPKDTEYHIVEQSILPTDNPFFNSWRMDNKGKVKPDMDVAKEIAHTQRRIARDAAFAPLDREATVPALMDVAEAKRESIRNSDAIRQIAIDSSSNTSELIEALKCLLS